EVGEAPLVAGGLMLFVGVLAFIAKCPSLFPSLGPTAFLQAEYPHNRMSGIYHVLMGHLLGACSGFMAVELIGAMDAPAATAGARPRPAPGGAVALPRPMTP